MNASDLPKVVETDEDERIFQLYGQIEAEKLRLKRNPPKTVDALANVLIGTVMPIMMDLAHYTKANTEISYELLDRVDRVDGAAGEDTQILPEHASRFELVFTYALGVAKASLEHVLPGSDEHRRISEIVEASEWCLKTLEESTLEPDDDDEGDGGDGDGPEARSVEKN